MGEDQVNRIERLLTELMATLKERCPARQKQIDENAADIDLVFDKVREVKETLARWSIFSTLATAALTAVVVKFFAG